MVCRSVRQTNAERALRKIPKKLKSCYGYSVQGIWPLIHSAEHGIHIERWPIDRVLLCHIHSRPLYLGPASIDRVIDGDVVFEGVHLESAAPDVVREAAV
jgi:hypothetical protein